MTDSDSPNQADEAHELQHHRRGNNAPNLGATATAENTAKALRSVQDAALTKSERATAEAPNRLSRRSVSWVRASELLKHGSGQLTAHGIAAAHVLNRAPHRAVGLDRMNTDPLPVSPVSRRCRLAPLSAFRDRRDHATRNGLYR